MGERVYLRSELPPSLLEELSLDSLASIVSGRPRDPSLIRLWVGTMGNLTPTHFDKCHGALVQCVGKKRFILASPEDSANVYPRPGSHTARVDFAAFDEDMQHSSSTNDNDSGEKGM